MKQLQTVLKCPVVVLDRSQDWIAVKVADSSFMTHLLSCWVLGTRERPW